MYSLMYYKIKCLRESLFTLIAVIWLLTRVYFLICYRMVFLKQSLFTLFTGYFLMFFYVLFPRENIFSIFAMIRFLAFILDNESLKQINIGLMHFQIYISKFPASISNKNRFIPYYCMMHQCSSRRNYLCMFLYFHLKAYLPMK